jgi:hypothetical protein
MARNDSPFRGRLQPVEIGMETYASAEEFLVVYDRERPGCLLLDVRLRQSNGLDLQDELHRRKATLPVRAEPRRSPAVSRDVRRDRRQFVSIL